MITVWPEMLVVAVQPGAFRPDEVADSNPPSVINCMGPPPPELTVRESVAVWVMPPPVPVTVTA